MGVMSLTQALAIAREANLDLVEVAPTSVPPVCRLLDYGKFHYLQDKKVKEARRHQHASEVREVRMRPKISAHDMELKVRVVKKLLEEGDKVKVTVMFRGREQAHPEIGHGLLNQVAKALEAEAQVERGLLVEGRRINILLSPRLVKGEKKVTEQVSNA